MSTKRIEYIDIAKGIGILLVALAHNDLALVSPYLVHFIYSFHIPLFFFLSGYFFKPKTSFWKFFKRRFNGVLKPYLFTIFLIYLVSVSFSKMSFKTAVGRIIKAMYATGIYIDWVQLWFLPSLFVTSIFAYLFFRSILAKISNRYMRWIVLLILQAVAVYFLDAFYPYSLSLRGKEYELYGLPYSIDLVLLSGFFYLLGSEIRQVSSEGWFDNIWLLIGTGSGLILLTTLFSQRIDFNTRLFESFPLNTLEAFLGILLTLAVSKQIDFRTSRLASALKYIGRASLFILIFHTPIEEFWGIKIYAQTEMRAFSILTAFAISIIVSLGFYKIFVEQNPIAMFVYGRSSSLPQKHAEDYPQDHNESGS